MSDTRKRSNSAPAVMSTQEQRTTTFLTLDPNGVRAPSAYHVKPDANQGGMMSQRSRQQHAHGPTNTQTMQAVHAFVDTPQKQLAVAKNVNKTVNNTKLNVSMALRMEIMDGTAKPTASHGAQHIETFTNAPQGRGNPHISGGTIEFAQPNSPLSDFNAVHSRTSQNKVALKSGAPLRPPKVNGATPNVSAEAQRFNANAKQAQAAFAKSVLSKE